MMSFRTGFPTQPVPLIGRPMIGATQYLQVPGAIPADTQQAVVLARDILRYMPGYAINQITIDQLVASVSAAGTAGSVGRIGICSADENWQPLSLLADAGTFVTDTNGVKTQVLSPNVLVQGRYLLMLNHNSVANVTFRSWPCAVMGMDPTLDGTLFKRGWSVISTFGAFTDPPPDWDIDTDAVEHFYHYHVACRLVSG